MKYLNVIDVSYPVIFLFFWGLMLVSCIGLWINESHKGREATKAEVILFWTFGSVMIAFAALRPIGIAPDDFSYVDLYNNICPTLVCWKWIQSSRDWGWYMLIGLAKSFWLDPRTMLIISGMGLFVKLWIIFKLCSRPMFSLLFFTAVFYQVQDLTALRVALSLSFFMFSIFLLSIEKLSLGRAFTCLPGLFHIQAFLSPLVLLAGILKKQYIVFVLLTLIPILLLLSGLNFRAYTEILNFQDAKIVGLISEYGLKSYLALAKSGTYENIRVVPYAYLPFILMIVSFSRNVFLKSNYLYCYCAMSFVIACWLAWVCAGWQEPQARFFEYFALPTVLLIGNFKNRLLLNAGTILVATVFVLRYNVLHPLLLG